MDVDELIDFLDNKKNIQDYINKLENALMFYSNPANYHAAAANPGEYGLPFSEVEKDGGQIARVALGL